VLVQGVGLTLDMKKYERWNGKFLVWNGMEWMISVMEWYGMEKLACYGIRKIYVPFHSMP